MARPHGAALHAQPGQWARSCGRYLQEFNRGLFDYLIATDDPAKAPAQQHQAGAKQKADVLAAAGAAGLDDEPDNSFSAEVRSVQHLCIGIQLHLTQRTPHQYACQGEVCNLCSISAPTGSAASLAPQLQGAESALLCLPWAPDGLPLHVALLSKFLSWLQSLQGLTAAPCRTLVACMLPLPPCGR